MPEEYFINQDEDWLGVMEIVEIKFPIPSVIEELEDLYLSGYQLAAKKSSHLKKWLDNKE